MTEQTTVMCRNEMDSRADTSCAGANFHIIQDTGYVCDVQPFHPSSKAVQDIPIGTCATVVTVEDSRDVLLVGHEMLYFGNWMRRTLINPKQLRHFGISVRDDYTREKEEGFGITVGDMIHIPFEMEGVTIYFEAIPSMVSPPITRCVLSSSWL